MFLKRWRSFSEIPDEKSSENPPWRLVPRIQPLLMPEAEATSLQSLTKAGVAAPPASEAEPFFNRMVKRDGLSLRKNRFSRSKEPSPSWFVRPADGH
jgi:hypothetical protein